MFKKSNPDVANLKPHWNLPARAVQTFKANDHDLIGVSTAEIVILRDNEPLLNATWDTVHSLRWDADDDTITVTLLQPHGATTVIKCTQSPKEIFMHAAREGIEQTHVLCSEHRSASGVDVQLWILKNYKGELRFFEHIGGELTPTEKEEIEHMKTKLKDSVGLDA